MSDFLNKKIASLCVTVLVTAYTSFFVGMIYLCIRIFEAFAVTSGSYVTLGVIMFFALWGLVHKIMFNILDIW